MVVPTFSRSADNGAHCCHGGHNEQAIGQRRALGDRRATFAQAPVCSWSGQAACAGSSLFNRHFVCAQDRHSLGGFSAGDGLLRHDTLEPPGGMEPSGSLAEAAPSASGSSAQSRADRLFTGDCRFIIGSCSAWGEKTGPSPTDRRKNGSKHHLAVEAGGLPLAIRLTGAHRHDVTQLLPLIDALPAVAGRPGAPLHKPEHVLADRGYDSQPHRRELRRRHIFPLIARRYMPNGSGLGIFRYVVERSLALLHQFRRLRTRFDKRDDIHQAFMTIGCAMICSRRLHNVSGYF